MTMILFGSAIIAWGITEAVKATLVNRLKLTEHVDTKEAKARLWWTPLLLIVSMAIGAGVGAVVGAVQWDALYGAFVGCVGGALASFLVALFKGHLAAAVGKLTGKSTE